MGNAIEKQKECGEIEWIALDAEGYLGRKRRVERRERRVDKEDEGRM